MPNILDSIQVSGSSYDIKDKNAPSVSAVTQQEYDNLPSSAKTSNTFFVITDATGGDLSNYVTLNSEQDITGQKTFVGNKRINFKQASSNNKLGFTLYNASNSELGFFEYGINNNKPYYELGFWRNSDSIQQPDLGFEIYDNYLKARYGFFMPQSSDAKEPLELTSTKTNFYTPLEFQNGTNKVRTANTGIVDLSTLIPTVTTSITSSSTDTQVPSAKAVYDTIGDIETLLSQI